MVSATIEGRRIYINISILGSTGSIGTQCLEVAEHLGNINVLGLSAKSNIDLLELQIRKYKPVIACVEDSDKAGELALKTADTATHIVAGAEGLLQVATLNNVDTVVVSVVGAAGLIPTMAAISERKNIALANKETLVAAGEIVMQHAKLNGVKILPIDSEHSAIFQCLETSSPLKNPFGSDISSDNRTGLMAGRNIKRILLTASGGPFFGCTTEQLADVTPAQALRHPNWTMGNKITIDSATLMNKGLEVIEARRLFGVDNITVLIHPQSIVHSAVEFIDNSIIAQMGVASMRVPIQYALTYPERCVGITGTELDLFENNSLTFSKPDLTVFKCLSLAYKALEIGGTAPAVLNAANEVVVGLFLRGQIGFLQIAEMVEAALCNHSPVLNPTLEDILTVDKQIRNNIVLGFAT